MRSPIGPILILLGLGTTVVLVLLLVQSMGLRSELERARADVAALQAQVEAQEEPMTAADLTRELDTLETDLREVIEAGGTFEGDPNQPAGGGDDSSTDEVLERLDLVLERITALDERVDDICEGVPVC